MPATLRKSARDKASGTDRSPTPENSYKKNTINDDSPANSTRQKAGTANSTPLTTTENKSKENVTADDSPATERPNTPTTNIPTVSPTKDIAYSVLLIDGQEAEIFTESNELLEKCSGLDKQTKIKTFKYKGAAENLISKHRENDYNLCPDSSKVRSLPIQAGKACFGNVLHVKSPFL